MYRYRPQSLLVAALLSLFSLNAHAEQPSLKRGLGLSAETATDVKLIQHSLAWWYNWRLTPNQEALAVSNDSFVPMAWGAKFDADKLRQYLRQHPNTEYLLGFNEPNFASQANMTPEQAAILWPQLQTIADEFHLKLVAPAVNYSPAGVTIAGKKDGNPFAYLDAFFKACQDCRVDYIAVHGYMGSAKALQHYLTKFHQRYHKPIWLTEWNLSHPKQNETQQQQLDFMASTVRWLEQQDYIYRYAWFVGRRTQQVARARQAETISGQHQWNALGELYRMLPAHDQHYAIPATIPAPAANQLVGMHHQILEQYNGGQIALQPSVRGPSKLTFDLQAPQSERYHFALDYQSPQSAKLKFRIDGGAWQSLQLAATGAQLQQSTKTEIALSGGEHQLEIVSHSPHLLLAQVRLQ